MPWSSMMFAKSAPTLLLLLVSTDRPLSRPSPLKPDPRRWEETRLGFIGLAGAEPSTISVDVCNAGMAPFGSPSARALLMGTSLGSTIGGTWMAPGLCFPEAAVRSSRTTWLSLLLMHPMTAWRTTWGGWRHSTPQRAAEGRAAERRAAERRAAATQHSVPARLLWCQTATRLADDEAARGLSTRTQFEILRTATRWMRLIRPSLKSGLAKCPCRRANRTAFEGCTVRCSCDTGRLQPSPQRAFSPAANATASS
mmetsp:Transcript_25380/g.74983  ORF Transcript_25380/g.74983 Transcript_25380/m.74983 type:complete len:254 (-) Transcript_25380:56-817(-)